MANVVVMSACDERERMDWTDWMGSDGCRKRARVCASPLEPRRSRTGERALCLSVPPYLPIQAHWDFASLVEWLAPRAAEPPPNRPGIRVYQRAGLATTAGECPQDLAATVGFIPSTGLLPRRFRP